MDFWNQHYYKIAKRISCTVGQWPYQSTLQLTCCRVIISILLFLQIAPRVRAVIIYGDNPDVLLNASVPFIMDAIMMIKVYTNCRNLKKMRLLLDTIKNNWQILSQKNEQRILHEHSAAGRKLSMIYLAAVFGGSGIYATEPIQMRLLTTLLKINITVPKFPMPVDYGPIDIEKYYYVFLFTTVLTVLTIAASIIACDLLFFIYSYHACGLFAILGYALEHLPVENLSDSFTNAFQYTKRCIAIHIWAIRFSKEIEKFYMWNFLGIVGLNMILLSITCVQIIVHLNAIEKVVQYSSLVVSQLGHVFVECLLGQRLLDYSLSIQKHISGSAWYHTTTESRRLLIIIMMRSQVPCQLTAGKIIIMCLQTFGVIIKTSVSYFTVLLAMR